MKSLAGKIVVSAGAMVVAMGLGAAAQAGEKAANLMNSGGLSACDLHMAMSDVLPPECQAKTRAIETGFLTGEEPPEPAPRTVSRSVALNILFELNSADLTADAKRDLKQVARFLAAPSNEGREFYILGHTDSKGSSDYNQRLSEKRAKAVTDFLKTAAEIDSVKITSAGMGETEPYDAGDPEADINRRVEISRVDLE